MWKQGSIQVALTHSWKNALLNKKYIFALERLERYSEIHYLDMGQYSQFFRCFKVDFFIWILELLYCTEIVKKNISQCDWC